MTKAKTEPTAEPEEEGRFPLPSGGPELPIEQPVDYAVPQEWLTPADGGWPAPLYRAPDIAGLQKLRVPFAPGSMDKLPKGVRKNQDGSDPRPENCTVCGGYHKPAAFHLDYVGHARVTDRLNSVDPLWFWEPYAEDPITKLPLLDYDSQNRPVGMWMKLHACGKTIIGYGSTEPKPDAIKELIGDGIRNAAMRLGVALHCWVKGEMESLADSPDSLGAGTGATKPPDRNEVGQPVITKPQREALIALFDELPEAERKEAKREFLAAFDVTTPNKLTQDRLEGARLWIAAKVDSYAPPAAPPAATDGSAPAESSGTATATTEPSPQPSRPSGALPNDGSWEGELPAHPVTGEALFPPADYVTGIETFLAGVTEDQAATFDAWLEDRGWRETAWTAMPQWMLFTTFNRLLELVEGSLPTTGEATDE